MTIEQTDQGILIKTTAPVNTRDVQKIIDYFALKELSSKNQGTQEQADELAREAETEWWEANKHRFAQ
jgi:predicted trehalose synthase